MYFLTQAVVAQEPGPRPKNALRSRTVLKRIAEGTGDNVSTLTIG